MYYTICSFYVTFEPVVLTIFEPVVITTFGNSILQKTKKSYNLQKKSKSKTFGVEPYNDTKRYSEYLLEWN